MVAMAIRVERCALIDVAIECGLQGYPYWASAERPLSDDDISGALRTGRFIAPDDNRDPNAPMSTADHGARVAWLVRNGIPEQVVVTVQDGRIVDGNHRFAMCWYLGVEDVGCVRLPSTLAQAA
jgi:hypothetical protein